jgi:hypothetical protein
MEKIMDKLKEYDAEIERLLGLLMVVYADKWNYRARLFNENAEQIQKGKLPEGVSL